jgi:hypothetical protein
MSRRRGKGNSGKAGTRAKNAAKRKWDKRKDVVFAASVGVGAYVTGHLIEAALHPFAANLTELIRAGLHGFLSQPKVLNDVSPARFEEIVRDMQAQLPRDGSIEAELLELRARLRRALLARRQALAIYAAATRRSQPGPSLQKAIARMLGDATFLRAPDLESKARRLEKLLNEYFWVEWGRYGIEGRPPPEFTLALAAASGA